MTNDVTARDAFLVGHNTLDEARTRGFTPTGWKICREIVNLIACGVQLDDHFLHFLGLPVVIDDSVRMQLVYTTPPVNEQLLHFAKVRKISEDVIRQWGKQLKGVIEAINGRGIVKSKADVDLTVAMWRATK